MSQNTRQTNIRMSEELLRSLKKRAAEEDKSLAQLMRELGEAYVSGSLQAGNKDIKSDSIWDLPSSGVSLGDPELSKKIDSILYAKRQ